MNSKGIEFATFELLELDGLIRLSIPKRRVWEPLTDER